MTTLNGKEIKRGDYLLANIGGQVLAGPAHEFYDRIGTLRFGGYALQVKASDTVLASDAWDALVPKKTA